MAISATLTAHNAPYGIDQTDTRMWLRGLLAWGAGTYAAGGVTPVAPPYLDASGQAVLLPTLNVLPDDVTFESISGSGYVYQRNKATGKIQIFVSGAATPAGTISAPVLTMNSYTPAGTNSAPTITTSSGGVSTALGVAAGALSEVTGASGITGVQAPTFSGTPATLTGTNSAPTFTGSAIAAGPLAELANGALPAGVTSDIIEFCATWVKQ